MSSPAGLRQWSASNDWVIETGPGASEAVLAGVSSADRTQGQVVVITQPVQSEPQKFQIEGICLSPVKVRALHLMGATGKVLELQAQDGTKLQFDFVTRAYR